MTVLEHELTELQQKEIKRIIEALLFASSDPVPFKKLLAIVKTYASIEANQLQNLLQELAVDYKEMGKAFKLEEIAQGYLLRTYPQYNSYICQLLPSKKDKLSQAALEVLAIIAFKQPITRTEIESIRGVDCSGMIQNLQERDLIEMSGKLEVPGRPSIYSVTKKFLVHFGLKTVEEIKSSE